MLDIGFLEQVLLDLPVAGGIENLFLDHRVDGELEADLPRELLLAALALRLFEFLEQLLDSAVVLFQQRDRVLRFGLGHEFRVLLLQRRNQRGRSDVPAAYAP